MREITIEQADNEIKILDKVSVDLRGALRRNYEDISVNNPAFRHTGGDIELAASLHNNRINLNEALEEVGRRGYGRVVFIREEDESGEVLRCTAYRVSQANAGLPEAAIIARNSRLGSQIASCRVGEEIEMRMRDGERYFVVTSLIDLEGAMRLLQPNPDIKLARFHVEEDPAVDVIRGVRAFLADLRAPSAPQDTGVIFPVEVSPEASVTEPAALAEQTKADLFWPSDWSTVIFADEPEAALGAQFFTRTTPQQEEAIQAVRGVTVVDGFAGTGKTSIALGRLKFFANFRSGEHLQEYGLDPNDWVDFDSSDMIGFVLSPSLVQYLKRTAEDLELRMKIMDFEEYRNHERQARHLFPPVYKRSPDRNSGVQQTARWLTALADVACVRIAERIESIQREDLTKPDTPDGKRVLDARWREIESSLWKAGPLRARIVGLTRSLKGGDGAPNGARRLQGIANAIDRDLRVSDYEAAALNERERRTLREAVLNISLRCLRMLNPSALYADAHLTGTLRTTLAKQFPEQAKEAIAAAALTGRRLGERLITDDDVVAALCLNAIVCDQFERDIKDIPSLRTFSDRVGVFIDEYQDFSEQQVFLMGFRAKRKYRQITVSGDASQRLHAGGIEHIAQAFPYVTDSIRRITLDTNFRQSESLARLSNCFRRFTQDGPGPSGKESCNAPIYNYQDRAEFAEFIAYKIGALPGPASVAVICPTPDAVRAWFDLMAPSLESAFRNPIISDRGRLTERLKTHFTTPIEAKGLEFDVAVVPDLSDFRDGDPIDLNGLYVAVSRPRYAILLGCDRSKIGHSVVKQLCDSGDLRLVSPKNAELAA